MAAPTAPAAPRAQFAPPSPGYRRTDASPLVLGSWLIGFALLVVALILVGGATRLTESGLSITEWRPVRGVLPPLDAAGWAAAFEQYRQIPQYEQLNHGLTLDGFRRIYLWEYAHRLLARLVGLTLVLPLAWFMVRRRIPRQAQRPLALLVALLLGQALLGWWMVTSGLSVRTEVSQYRLAAHLAVALVILSVAVWTAADLLQPRPTAWRTVPRRRTAALRALFALVFLSAISGAFVAGLRAGRIYNSFPLMGGRVVPPGYGQLGSWWRDAFENPVAAQFHHRVLAVTTVLVAITLWGAFGRSPDRRVTSRMQLVLAAALLQLTLGITTLLLAVPVPLGVAHQGGAVLLLITVLLALHAVRHRADGPAGIAPTRSHH